MIDGLSLLQADGGAVDSGRTRTPMKNNCSHFLRRYRLHLVLAGVVALIGGIIAGRHWYVEHFCPMFYYVSEGEHALFAPWCRAYPAVDAAGNFVIRDARLNVLLVVVTPVRGMGMDFWRPAWKSIAASARRNGASICLDVACDRRTEISRTTDALIAVLPDGTRSQAPLKPGQADSVFSAIQFDYTTSEPSDKPIFSSIEEALTPEDAEARALMRRCQEVFRRLPTTSSAPASGR